MFRFTCVQLPCIALNLAFKGKHEIAEALTQFLQIRLCDPAIVMAPAGNFKRL